MAVWVEVAALSEVSRPALPGLRKAAVLLAALGLEASSRIFRHLDEAAIAKLALELARLPAPSPEVVDHVLHEFFESREARRFVREGGVEYAREVLARAYGARRAEEILSRTVNVGPLEFLHGYPPETIALFLAGEMPQTIALVLSHLPTLQQAGAVLERLPPGLQVEIALRISLTANVPAELVGEIGSTIRDRLEHVRVETGAPAARGIPRLAEILGAADRTTGRKILEQLDQTDPPVAEAVRSLLFVFEDLARLDDRSLQLALREVDHKDVALALLGTAAALQERLLANISARSADAIREEMDYLRPQRRRTVEEAQTKIINAIRRLEHAELITAPATATSEPDLI